MGGGLVGGGGGVLGLGGGRKITAWQEYVKLHLREVREKNKGLGMKGWMEVLGRGFREEQGRGGEEIKEGKREEERMEGKGKECEDEEGGLMRFEGLRVDDDDFDDDE